MQYGQNSAFPSLKVAQSSCTQLFIINWLCLNSAVLQSPLQLQQNLLRNLISVWSCRNKSFHRSTLIWLITLKWKYFHFDEIFITGCTESCQNDNFQCSQWWKIHQNSCHYISVKLESRLALISEGCLFDNYIHSKLYGNALYWMTFCWCSHIPARSERSLYVLCMSFYNKTHQRCKVGLTWFNLIQRHLTCPLPLIPSYYRTEITWPYWTICIIWTSRVSFDLLHELTLVATRKCNYMSSKLCDEITYPFPNFKGYTIEVWEWISNFITLYLASNFLSMLGFKQIHVSEGAPELNMYIVHLSGHGKKHYQNQNTSSNAFWEIHSQWKWKCTEMCKWHS